MDELTLDGKVYISSKLAAKITGYAKDYIGQLCREGRVEARSVGRNWYVLEDSIREHRFGKESVDALDEELENEENKAKTEVLDTWEAPTYRTEQEMPVIPPLTALRAPESGPETARIVSDMQVAWKEWFEVSKSQTPTVSSADSEVVSKPEIRVEIPAVESEIANDYSVPEPEPVLTRVVEEEPSIGNLREEVRISHESIRERSEPSRSVIPHVINLRSSRGVIDLASRPVAEEMGQVEVPVISSYSRPYRTPAPSKERMRSNFVLQAVLLSVACLTLVVALVGSGITDSVLASRSAPGGLQGAVINFLQGESVLTKQGK